jgi:hypothetical protein
MDKDELKKEVSAWVNGADRYQQNLQSHLDYATDRIMDAVDKYARAKWDEAVEQGRKIGPAKPEFKP